MRKNPERRGWFERRLIAQAIEFAVKGSEKIVWVFIEVDSTLILAQIVPAARRPFSKELSNKRAAAG